MKVVIDPAWSLVRTVEAARDAYVGSGKTSRGYRLSVLMVWGNLVGRRRANLELNALLLEAGSEKGLAAELGISLGMLRKLGGHFQKVPDHRVTSVDGGRDLSTLRDFSFLGRGGYGQVWSASDSMSRRVAVKFMSASTTEIEKAVLAHASPLAALGNHPNVVMVYYCDGVDHPTSGIRVPAMVMEFIEGTTLGELLRQFIPFEFAVAIGEAVCAGLLHIHSKGLTHGDLHDDNVMIPNVGEAKLIDLMNHRTVSQFTSGTRRLGTNDDVEALKALLCNLLRKTPMSRLASAFEVTARAQTTVAGVRATFQALTRPPVRVTDGSSVGEFLLVWNELERTLRARYVATPGAIRTARSPVSVAAMLEQVLLADELRQEIDVLRQVRNAVVHGEVLGVEEATVRRTQEVIGLMLAA